MTTLSPVDAMPHRLDPGIGDVPWPEMSYWLAPAAPVPVANVLTIDLEDWPISVLGPDHEVTDRVVGNTRRCLQVLRWHDIKATFFVLGRVAERFPELIEEVHAAGHEIASHGYGHELLTRMSPREFEADLRRSTDILTDIVHERPIGYRAPAYSLVDSTRWAVRILADHGFKYSSSVFPIHHRRYGIADAPTYIHRWRNSRLIECPPATLPFLGQNLPIAGGGYFRLLPGSVARQAIRCLNRRNRPAILYLHPYELDVDGISAYLRQGHRVGGLRRLTQQAFRGRMEDRLHKLCAAFRFTTMRDLLKYAL